MGEDLFNFVLSDINGIPALPVFIGNYLLDLLSTFFPIFVLLSAFVMLYTGLTRGGDWKSTGQQLAPTAISMAVIMGLLSMKTPYTSADGGAIGGSFWQDTNSYTVVEMMNTFLGFGNIFADALTHKIIYGSIEVTNGNTSFDGYFPAVLQAMMDKSKDEEVKQFLLETANRKEILKEVNTLNKTLGTSTKVLVTNLHNLGIVDDFRRVRGTYENTGNDVGSYKNIDKITFIGDCQNFTSNNFHNGMCFYYTPAKFSNVVSGDVKNIDSNGGEKKTETCDLTNNFCKSSFKLDVDITNESEGSDKDTYTINLNKFIETKYANVSSGSATPKLISSKDSNAILAYMNRKNFEQEGNMIAIVGSLLSNYKKIYEAYQKEYNSLKGKMDSATKKSEKELIFNTMKPYQIQMNTLKAQISNVAGLYKDYQIILNTLTNSSPMLETSVIDSVMGANYYANLKSNMHFSQDEIKKMFDYNSTLTLKEIPMYRFSMSEDNKANRRSLAPVLNGMMRSKAYITTVMYDKFKSVLQDDALFQTKMGFASTCAFNAVFLDENKLKALTFRDDKKEEISKKYLDDVTGKQDVAKTLKLEIEKQYSTNELGKGNVIHWTDLGKYYATFKNLYSPMITNIYALEQMNSIDYERTMAQTQFLAELEPSAKTSRLLEAAGIMAGGAIAVGSVKFVANAMAGGGVKAALMSTMKKGKDNDSFGSLWDAIKIIGGMYFAILFVNVILPAFIWMFVIITYYVEMSLYVAVFPLGFMFMIFQSYRQSLHQYINMLLGFILMPVVLVSMYFVILYIDMLLPMFFKQFMPFFGNYNEVSSAFSLAFGGADSLTNDIMSTVVDSGEWIVDEAKDAMGVTQDLTSKIGNILYTFLSMMMSTLLLMTFFRANEYMSKILNVSTIGMDSFQGQSTLNKFGSFDKSGLTAGVVGR